jgi:hypothetical protein
MTPGALNSLTVRHAPARVRFSFKRGVPPSPPELSVSHLLVARRAGWFQKFFARRSFFERALNIINA